MIQGPATFSFVLGVSFTGSEVVDGRVHLRRVDAGPLAAWEHEGMALFRAAELSTSTRVAELVDAVERIPGFSCCNLVAGLRVLVDDRDWTGGTTDHVFHATHWLHALDTLRREGDGASTCTFVWDQSSLVLRRDGWALELEDVQGQTPGDPFTFHPLVTLYDDACRQLAEEGAALLAACDALRAELARRGMTAEVAKIVLAGLGHKPRAVLGDRVLVHAIVWRELEDTVGLEAAIAGLRVGAG